MDLPDSSLAWPFPALRPDYAGGSLANLMTSIAHALDGENPGGCPPLARDPLGRVEGPLVLLVLDGLGYDYVTRHGRVLVEHLQGSLTSVCPSTTAAAVTTLTSGLAPAHHGLTGWHIYLRELGAVVAALPFVPRLGGAGLATAGYDAATLFQARPFSNLLPVPCFQVLPHYIADSPVSRAFRGRARALPYRGLDDFFNQLSYAVRQARGPAYIHGYWSEFDSLCHEHGVGGDAVAEHFRQFEWSLGNWLVRLRGSGTTLVATADHGFIDAPPDRTLFIEDHPPLADALLLPLCGEPRFAYCYLRPGREQTFVDYIASELGDALVSARSQRLLDEGWFGPPPHHPELARRIGDRVVVPAPGWQLKDRLAGQPRNAQLGVHGGVSPQEMRVPLIVART